MLPAPKLLSISDFAPIGTVLDNLCVFNETEGTFWNMIPEYYSSMPPVVQYFDIYPTSHEGCFLSSELVNQMKLPNSLRVQHIKRIQNPFLFATYLVRKNEIRKNNPSAETMLLAHGTLSIKIDSIATHNFSLNYIKRAQYGRGIYFTSNLKYAAKFCDAAVEKYIILAYVFRGKACQGEPNLLIPEKDCDTSISYHHGNSTKPVIVKYDEESVYPAYLLILRSNSI